MVTLEHQTFIIIILYIFKYTSDNHAIQHWLAKQMVDQSYIAMT